MSNGDPSHLRYYLFSILIIFIGISFYCVYFYFDKAGLIEHKVNYSLSKLRRDIPDLKGEPSASRLRSDKCQIMTWGDKNDTRGTVTIITDINKDIISEIDVNIYNIKIINSSDTDNIQTWWSHYSEISPPGQTAIVWDILRSIESGSINDANLGKWILDISEKNNSWNYLNSIPVHVIIWPPIHNVINTSFIIIL